jgi:uncharacterized membrane protein YqhA
MAAAWSRRKAQIAHPFPGRAHGAGCGIVRVMPNEAAPDQRSPSRSPTPPGGAPGSAPERALERLLWSSRLLVLPAVLASLAAAVTMFFLATADTVYLVGHALDYVRPSLSAAERADIYGATVRHVVEIVDGYLLATFLLIFALGLYELFISKIDAASGSETADSVLVVLTLDDLKNRLAKVILMILIVKFFEHVLAADLGRPVELLYVAAGIALVGAALWFSHAAEAGKERR